MIWRMRRESCICARRHVSQSSQTPGESNELSNFEHRPESSISWELLCFAGWEFQTKGEAFATQHDFMRSVCLTNNPFGIDACIPLISEFASQCIPVSSDIYPLESIVLPGSTCSIRFYNSMCEKHVSVRACTVPSSPS